MTIGTSLMIATVLVALTFDVLNGFHDAANSIATVVSTGVLSPRTAVLWAAFFNFVAMFVFAPKVADTIAKIVAVRPNDPFYVYVVLAGLWGAIVWNLLSWWWGLPTSSSHALIGGLVGAGVAHAGWSVIEWGAFWATVHFMLLAPLIGFSAAVILMQAVSWLHRRRSTTSMDAVYRRGQLFSSALYSLGHGGNDAQKTMGVIVAVMIAGGLLPPGIQLSLFDSRTLWIILACHAAMAFGTALAGWRIVATLGMKLTRLRPRGGFCAEASGSFTLFFATSLGIPVSTTHTITGAIIGVGTVDAPKSINWSLARRIVWGWFLTIPAAGLVAAGFVKLAAHGQADFTP